MEESIHFFVPGSAERRTVLLIRDLLINLSAANKLSVSTAFLLAMLLVTEISPVDYANMFFTYSVRLTIDPDLFNAPVRLRRHMGLE